MSTEDVLQYLLVNDHAPYVPALPAGLAVCEAEGGEGPRQLGDARPPPLLLLARQGGGGELVAELGGGVVTLDGSALLHP